MTTPTYQPTSTRTTFDQPTSTQTDSDMIKLLTKQASSMEKLLTNVTTTNNQHLTSTQSSMKKLLCIQISGMNKLIAHASTSSLVQDEFICVKFTFDINDILITDNISTKNNDIKVVMTTLHPS